MSEENLNTNDQENLLYADIPEKFKDPNTGEPRIDQLAKSYKELEKRLTHAPKAPKSPEEYCIECSHHGLFEPDLEINRRLHAKGFSQDQAQELYDLAAERMIPMMQDMAADFQADREVEKLINHFGGTEQWKEISRQLLAYGQKNLPHDVLDNLSSSYEGVLALHRMMKGAEPSLQKGRAQSSDKLGEAELSAMMKDPKYWREKDPAFIAKVTKGFENLYGR